jgi:hypothetical protein
LAVDVTSLDLVPVNAKLVETVATNEMDGGKSQLFSALVAILLVKVLRLRFH